MNFTLGYVMIYVFGIKYDSIPFNNIFFIYLLSLPISYNNAIFIQIMNAFSRFRSIIHLTQICKIHPLNDYNIKQHIKFTMKLFDKMNDIVLSLNKIYTVNIIISLFNITVVVIFNIFLMHNVFSKNLEFNDFAIALGGFSYAAGVSIGCIAIIYFSSSIKRNYDLVLNNLTRVHLILRSRKIHQQIHTAILQITHFRKNICCGLFELNWQLVFAIFVSILNYVIVMIQFEKMLYKA